MATTWSASTSLSVGNIIAPTSASAGLFFKVTVAGTTGSSEPSWATSIGETVYDNDVRYVSFSATFSDLQPINPSAIIELFTLKLDTITIHNLVARCYLGYKKNSCLVIDHIDNNKLNNYIHNLQLITQSQNCRKEHMKKLQKNGLPFYIHFTPKGYIVKFLENKQKKSLGVYENIELALNARNDYFKDFFKDIKM